MNKKDILHCIVRQSNEFENNRDVSHFLHVAAEVLDEPEALSWLLGTLRKMHQYAHNLELFRTKAEAFETIVGTVNDHDLWAGDEEDYPSVEQKTARIIEIMRRYAELESVLVEADLEHCCGEEIVPFVRRCAERLENEPTKEAVSWDNHDNEPPYFRLTPISDGTIPSGY